MPPIPGCAASGMPAQGAGPPAAFRAWLSKAWGVLQHGSCSTSCSMTVVRPICARLCCTHEALPCGCRGGGAAARGANAAHGPQAQGASCKGSKGLATAWLAAMATAPAPSHAPAVPAPTHPPCSARPCSGSWPPAPRGTPGPPAPGPPRPSGGTAPATTQPPPQAPAAGVEERSEPFLPGPHSCTGHRIPRTHRARVHRGWRAVPCAHSRVGLLGPQRWCARHVGSARWSAAAWAGTHLRHLHLVPCVHLGRLVITLAALQPAGVGVLHAGGAGRGPAAGRCQGIKLQGADQLHDPQVRAWLQSQAWPAQHQAQPHNVPCSCAPHPQVGDAVRSSLL